MGLKKLPVGIDRFEKIIENDFYYVDKTMFIEELLNNWGEVNLFTRPRRFGKSLNMSMLQNSFEIGTDKTVFGGLKITDCKSLCDEHMMYNSFKDNLDYDSYPMIITDDLDEKIWVI